jgi:hypothetical protein
MEIKADVVFVSDLEVSGFLNGVINLAFSTAQFVPETVEDDQGQFKTVVATAASITANLRMDLRLAQVVRDRLDAIIEENTKARVSN